MIEYCLYGVRLVSDTALFDHGLANSAFAPGESRPLRLERQHAEHTPQRQFSEAVPLFTTHGRDTLLYTVGEFIPGVTRQPWAVEVVDVVSFSWRGGDDTLYYQLHQEGTPQLLAFWFVHIFLPLYLALERSYDFLHCAAVEVNDVPVLFVAPSRGGKSTLADHFLRRGHPLLSDDKVATVWHDDAFYAIPSHPYHRPFREFEVLGFPVDNFASSAKPIHAFYILERGEPDSSVQISEVTGVQKFEALMPGYLYNFAFLRKQRLRWLAQLADQSSVFRVVRPWNMARTEEVYATICEDIHARADSGH